MPEEETDDGGVSKMAETLIKLTQDLADPSIIL